MDELLENFTEEQKLLLAHDCIGCENCKDLEEHLKKCLKIK